ncbi:MAG: type I restriction enzyme HsdR N-terminal domain-containing protein, partial [Pyrinomonadaceae bacterium]|nr:type I restriction enzyme HsdR N-terminal domain-containing protein [Pyrinomonadaceae bacterium]
VKNTLQSKGIFIETEFDFGSEPKFEWLTFSVIEPQAAKLIIEENRTSEIYRPSQQWFEKIEKRKLESEREVEHFFIMPLLKELGYAEEDCAIGYRITMAHGSKKTNKEADFVIFDGEKRDGANALIIIEAKKGEKALDDAALQARSYALWLFPPYYVVTNGEKIRVFHFRDAKQSDVKLMDFSRNDLREKWNELYRFLGKLNVINLKQQIS